MKKLMTAVLAACMVIAIPSTIFADEVQDVPQVVDQDSQEETSVKLYAEVGSTYAVRLPEKVDVETSPKGFDVEAKGDISSTEKLSVSFPETATLVDTNTGASKKDDIDLTISNNSHDFAYDDLKDDYDENVKFTVSVSHDDAVTAGTWEVDLPVTITLASAE